MPAVPRVDEPIWLYLTPAVLAIIILVGQAPRLPGRPRRARDPSSSGPRSPTAKPIPVHWSGRIGRRGRRAGGRTTGNGGRAPARRDRHGRPDPRDARASGYAGRPGCANSGRPGGPPVRVSAGSRARAPPCGRRTSSSPSRRRSGTGSSPPVARRIDAAARSRLMEPGGASGATREAMESPCRTIPAMSATRRPRAHVDPLARGRYADGDHPGTDPRSLHAAVARTSSRRSSSAGSSTRRCACWPRSGWRSAGRRCAGGCSSTACRSTRPGSGSCSRATWSRPAIASRAGLVRRCTTAPASPHADLGGDRVHFVPGSSGLKVLDHRTGETRLANSTDFVEYVRLGRRPRQHPVPRHGLLDQRRHRGRRVRRLAPVHDPDQLEEAGRVGRLHRARRPADGRDDAAVPARTGPT